MNASIHDWNFLSNYAHVLVSLAKDPHARLRDVAARVGITERTAMRLVTQLEEAGIVNRLKQGRRNSYTINMDAHLRHGMEAHCTVGELLSMILNQTQMRALKRSAAQTELSRRSEK